MLRNYFGINLYYSFAFWLFKMLYLPLFCPKCPFQTSLHKKILFLAATAVLHRMTWNFGYELLWAISTLCEMHGLLRELDLLYCREKTSLKMTFKPKTRVIICKYNVYALKNPFDELRLFCSSRFNTTFFNKQWTLKPHRTYIFSLKLLVKEHYVVVCM